MKKKIKGKKECLNAKNHTERPEQYIAWHNWAERKSKTHRQIKYKGCGLYEIWIPQEEEMI